jgi:hypothetical protein
MPTLNSITKMLNQVPAPPSRTNTNHLDEESFAVVIAAAQARRAGSPDEAKKVAEAQAVLDIAWGANWGKA